MHTSGGIFAATERGLVRNVRQATGMRVFDWITREQVNHATVLFGTTEFRIAEIAAMVAFGTPETLRRHFEKLVGRTAGRYRDAFREDAAAAVARPLFRRIGRRM